MPPGSAESAARSNRSLKISASYTPFRVTDRHWFFGGSDADVMVDCNPTRPSLMNAQSQSGSMRLWVEIGSEIRLRACLKIPRGAAARDFDWSLGGLGRASPQRAVRPKPTTAPGKSTTARRVFAESAAWRRCSAVTDRYGYAPLSRLAIQLILRKQHPSEFSDRLLPIDQMNRMALRGR
jgi:hypothetical protein